MATTMMLQAAKKSTFSSALRWNKPAAAAAATAARNHHGIGSKNAIRAFVSASSKNIHNGVGNYRTFSSATANAAVIGKIGRVGACVNVGNPNQVSRMTPSVMGLNFDAKDHNMMVGRSDVGNPSTMAFLGIRAKSSGAAFRQQMEEEEDAIYDAVVGGFEGGGAGRSHQEAWMVNLGRGDEEWLSKPRSGEWFTGMEPSVCPGEYHFVYDELLCYQFFMIKLFMSRRNISPTHLMKSFSILLLIYEIGVDEKGVLRSLPLPNLSAVTRQGAKDYFDNSWTLFEMLFAGLKGDEPFYR